MIIQILNNVCGDSRLISVQQMRRYHLMLFLWKGNLSNKREKLLVYISIYSDVVCFLNWKCRNDFSIVDKLILCKM